MKHIMQRGQTCLIASLAMVLDKSYDEVVKLIGHDGTEVAYQGAVYPLRGIHTQEAMNLAWGLGLAMVVVETFPQLGAMVGGQVESQLIDGSTRLQARMYTYLDRRRAVLLGLNATGGPHAVAYDGEIVFDPNGTQYPLADFGIREAWLFLQSNQIERQ